MTRKGRQKFDPNNYPSYFKRGENNMIVKLNGVRLAFPNLFEPKSVNGGSARYSASFIIDPEDPVCDELRTAMREVAEAKWGDKGEKVLEQLIKSDRVCLRDGDTKSEYGGFEGMMFVSASNATRPLVVDRNRSVLTQADGKIYSGCRVNTSVELWAQDNKYGKRINASLRGVQFDRDDDAFSGGTPASADEFDDLGDGADEDALA